MRIRLDARLTKQLLRFPESGMGYQCVDIRFRNGRKLENVPVFNAEEVELPEEFARVEITELWPHA
jgi:hypothetical protein